MRKDEREVALQQAKHQAEIQSTQDWLKFFKKHLIPSDKETLWRDKFGSNVEGAEDLYEDAKSKGQEILGEDFNDTEKRRIFCKYRKPKDKSDLQFNDFEVKLQNFFFFFYFPTKCLLTSFWLSFCSFAASSQNIWTYKNGQHCLIEKFLERTSKVSFEVLLIFFNETFSNVSFFL
jgi:hypothetical protein